MFHPLKFHGVYGKDEGNSTTYLENGISLTRAYLSPFEGNISQAVNFASKICVEIGVYHITNAINLINCV